MEYIVSELAELNNLAGKDPVSTQVLLSKLRKGITGFAKASKSAFGGIIDNCDNGSKKLSGFIKKLIGDVKADGAKRGIARGRVKKAKASQKKYYVHAVKTNKGIKTLRARLIKERANYQRFEVEAVAKNDVVKRLRDIINDELMAAAAPAAAKKTVAPAAAHVASNSTNSTGAFIQISNAVQELKEKLGDEQDIMVSPLVSALLAIASEKRFSNQRILKKILRLLNKIDSNLRSFLKKHGKAYASIVKQIKKQLKSKLGQSRNYFALFHGAKADVKFALRCITFQGETIAKLNQHIKTKQAELKRWNALCNHQRGFYKGIQSDIKNCRAAIKAIGNAVNK